MKKRIVSLALTLLLMLSLSSFAYAANDVSSVRQGVVRIVEVFDVDGADSAISLGSGFFVGKSGQNVRYLMTNFHVVSEYILNGSGAVFEFRDDYGYRHTGQVSLRVYFDANSYLEASVVDYDENQDIALLKLEGYTDQRDALALRIPTDDMVGDSVYIVGYPGNSDDYSNPTSVWGAEDSLVTKGTIGRLVTESGTNAKWIQSSDLIISNGASGGPLVNESGDVLGMVCWGVDSSSSADHMNMCVNIELVVDMLRKNNVDFEMASDRAAAQTAPAQTEPAQAEPTPAPAIAKYDPTLIASALVFVVSIIILIIISARKSAKAKKQAEAAAAAAAAAYAVENKTVAVKSSPSFTAVARSLAEQHGGKHGGKKIKIGSEPLIAGRGRDCKLIYDEKTPGVSGRHCAIAWDADRKEFIIKDLGSTYGTYLDSGMKLDPSRVYRLKPGESFYLGDRANTIRVEVE